MIDTHCHIDLFEQPLQIAQAAEQSKIRTVAVTYLPSHYELALRHLKGFRFVHPALGLHPLSANDHAGEIGRFCEIAKDAYLIGEVGLDFSASAVSTRAIQEESFERVLGSIRRDAFVTLHSRGAEDAVVSALTRSHDAPVVFHWFSGSREQLLRVVTAGHYISLNPAMTKTAKWQELIMLVPSERVLTESDGPFSKWNGKPASPLQIEVVIRWLSERWRQPEGEVAERIERNFRTACPHLFSTGGPP